MNCRFCGNLLQHQFIDLVNAPPSNSFLNHVQLDEPETFYPLKLWVCQNCFLVQIAEYKKSQDIFSDEYIYFSSYSTSWLEHARHYVEMITARLALAHDSFAVEIASNDGYLLRNFIQKKIPCLGIEPTKGTANVAKEKGIEVLCDFFGADLAGKLAAENRRADLIIGNNVLAHVPDINDFVAGLKILLKEDGVINMEFPHLLCLVEYNQFDTIYHEHFSYLSLSTVQRIFAQHGLVIFDVDELSTHGGSLRIYAGHEEDNSKKVLENVERVIGIEEAQGIKAIKFYEGFQAKADKVKYDLLSFLIEQKQAGKKVAAYGAAAKGNTLLNYCGIKKDLIDFVVDASPHKQGKYLPGSHIPVVSEEQLRATKPDFVLILPWNIKEEIAAQINYVNEWGCKFVVPVPGLHIF